jgi:hypothetical protein
MKKKIRLNALCPGEQNHMAFSSVISYLIPISLFFIASAFFLLNSFSIFDFPLDDAWIHRVYSRSFAFGNGFQYNEGIQEAGQTSPLWAVISSPAHWIERLWGTNAMVVVVKLIGFALGIIIISTVRKITEVISHSQMLGMVTASLLALEPRLLFSVFSGMENILLIALWITATYQFIKKKWGISFLLFGLTPVTRPEALIVLPICILALFFLGEKKFLKRPAAWGGLLLPFFLWSIFCRFTNGHFLPNTFYLKSRPFSLDLKSIEISWKALSQHGFASLFIFLVGIIVFILFVLKCSNFKTKTFFLFVFMTPILYLLGVVGTRQIVLQGYYWTRWVDPASILLTIPFCIGYSFLLTGTFDFSKIIKGVAPATHKRFLSIIVIFSAFIGLVFSFSSFSRSFEDRRMHLASDSRVIHLINVSAGQWIKKNTSPDSKVGVNDSGAIRYFGDRFTVDLIGLNNSEIAFGEKKGETIFKDIDWLAIFPSWFPELRSFISERFVPKKVFSVPLEEFTICQFPGQSRKVLFKKK